MTHFRRLVATISSPQYERQYYFTLPLVNADDCDVHFVHTQAFMASELYKKFAQTRDTRYKPLISDPIRTQTLGKLLANSGDHPAPMPYARKYPKGSGKSMTIGSQTVDLVLTLIQLGVKSFPFCVERNDNEPGEISRELSAFRIPEPAQEWVSHSEDMTIVRNGIPYPASDSHLLQDVDEHFNEQLGNNARLLVALERIRFKLSRTQSAYDEAYKEAMESGGNPDFDPSLAWNSPLIVSHRALMAEEANLLKDLSDRETVEACRPLIDLALVAGKLGINVPEPDQAENFLGALNSLQPAIEEEIARPSAEPIELVRRFFVLYGLIQSRREQIWVSQIEEGAIIPLEGAAVPLARAIADDSETAALARSALGEKALAYLKKTATASSTITTLSSFLPPKFQPGSGAAPPV